MLLDTSAANTSIVVSVTPNIEIGSGGSHCWCWKDHGNDISKRRDILMATLRVTSLRGRTSGTSPELPDGAVVTGVTTTGSAIVGAAVTINASGGYAGAGIITATSFTGNLTGNVTGSATTIAGV